MSPKPMILLNNIDIKRFYSSVDKSDGPLYCWNWTSTKIKKGYGRFHLRGKRFLAHRISYLIAFGNISTDDYICHRCDNPCCVNPLHLFAGSKKDNSIDCAIKGRIHKHGRPGELSPNCKLTNRKVLRIRALYKAGNITYRELALKFGIKEMEICRIIKRQRWNHI